MKEFFKNVWGGSYFNTGLRLLSIFGITFFFVMTASHAYAAVGYWGTQLGLAYMSAAVAWFVTTLSFGQALSTFIDWRKSLDLSNRMLQTFFDARYENHPTVLSVIEPFEIIRYTSPETAARSVEVTARADSKRSVP